MQHLTTRRPSTPSLSPSLHPPSRPPRHPTHLCPPVSRHRNELPASPPPPPTTPRPYPSLLSVPCSFSVHMGRVCIANMHIRNVDPSFHCQIRPICSSLKPLWYLSDVARLSFVPAHLSSLNKQPQVSPLPTRYPSPPPTLPNLPPFSPPTTNPNPYLYL